MKPDKLIPILLGLLSALMSLLIGLVGYVWVDNKEVSTVRDKKIDEMIEKLIDRDMEAERALIKSEARIRAVEVSDAIQDDRIDCLDKDVQHLKFKIR